MQNEQKIPAVIGVAAVLAIVALLYGSLSIQDASAKLEERNSAVSNLGTGNAANPVPAPSEITLTLITDSTKPSLVELGPLISQLGQIPEIKITSQKKLEIGSDESKQLIEKYNIEKIPAILLQGKTNESATLTQNWPQLGTIETDGTMVLRDIPPIYLETGTGKLRGETKATFVSVPDKNGVFDAEEVYTQILQSAFGVNPVQQETISYASPEGKAFLSKYNLEQIPAVILSGDLNAYNGFPQAWLQGGTVEADGNYIFRSLEAIQGIKYFDLNKNAVVETQPSRGE